MRIFFSKIFLSICLVFSAYSYSFAAPLSAYDFVRPTDFSNMTISPDGKYAAFSRTTTRKYCLDRFKTNIAKSQTCSEKNKKYKFTYGVVIYNLLENKVETTFDVHQNVHISWLKFANDRQLLISLSSARISGRMHRIAAHFIKEEVVSVTVGPDMIVSDGIRLSAMSNQSKGNGDFVLTSSGFGSSQILSIPDNDKELIVVKKEGQYSTLKKASIYEDKSEDITKGDNKTRQWLLNSKSVPTVRVACAKKKKCDKIEVFHSKDGSNWDIIRTIEESETDGYITEVFHPFDIDEATGEILVVSRTDDDKRINVKAFDPESRSFTKTIYEHPVYDVDHILFDPKTNKSVGVVTYSDKPEFHITDPLLKSHYDILKTQLGADKNYWIVDNNIHGQRAMIYVSSPHKTGQYYIYDPATKTAAFAMDLNRTLAKAIRSDGQAIQVKARDGANIDVYRYYPEGQETGAPLIVMPHGGPHVRDYYSYDPWVQYFVSQGYQVMQVNFRGSSGYGVAHEVAGFGEWGGVMQDDVTDAVKYIQEQGYASPENTCIVGYSYGGYAALYGGATTPELYACIVSGGGVSDLVRSEGEDRARFSDQTFSFLTNSVGYDKDKAFLKAISPINLTDNFIAPVLLLHGERDNRVLATQSGRMRDSLKKADKPVTYVPLEGEGHDGWTLENEILYLETVSAFLSEHIGP